MSRSKKQVSRKSSPKKPAPTARVVSREEQQPSADRGARGNVAKDADRPVSAPAAPRLSKEQQSSVAKASASAEEARSASIGSRATQNPPTPSPSAPAPRTSSKQPVSAGGGRRKWRFNRNLLAALLLLAAVLGVGWWYLFLHDPNPQQQNQNLVREVAKLAVVPKDEVPSVTTVVDEGKVNQEFLRSARKGDKVLLYFQAGRAIVYRPSTHQIVNMGPLETPKPRVFLRNGTDQNFLDPIASKINGSSDFLLASRDESPQKDYAKTVVVDVTGNRPDIAQRLARLLNASVIPMPEDESKPDADMLVIVGRDAKPSPTSNGAAAGQEEAGSQSDGGNPQ
jgi:hypothetical protein